MENESQSHVKNAQFAQGTGVNLETVTPEDPFCAQSQLPSEGVGVGDCEHRQVLSHPTEHC